MKKNGKLIKNILYFSSALLLSMITLSCTTSYQNQIVTISHDTESILDSDKYKRVLMTGFVQKSENSFDLNKEIYDFLHAELQRRARFLILYEKPFEITLTSLKSNDGKLAFNSENIFKDEKMWRQIAYKYDVDLIITGEASFTNKVVKDIEKQTRYSEGKQYQVSRLVERKLFTLDINLYYIDKETGKPIHTLNLNKEKRYYKDAEESANILTDIMRDLLSEIRLVMIKKQQPVKRILLD